MNPLKSAFRAACTGALHGLLLLAASNFAHGAPVRGEHLEAELIAENTSVQPSKPFTVAVRLKMEKHWHTYWINPGDAGLATRVDWTLPEGYQAGGIQWPTPVRIEAAGGQILYGYEDEILLLTEITPPAVQPAGQSVPLKAHVSWLVCAEVCIPGEADLTAATNVAKLGAAPSADPHWTQLFAAARQQLPTTVSDWQFQAETTADGYNLIAKPLRADAVWPAGKLFFFSADPVIIESSAEQPIQADGKGHIISLTKSAFAADAPQRLRGVLAAAGGWGGGLPSIVVDAAVGPGAGTVAASGTGALQSASNAPVSFASLAGSLALGLLGGLILNLMPCVFPVIGLKIVGFVNQSGEDHKKVTLHGLVFTAGVLVSFWGLAALLAVLRAGGDQLGWGFQLQSPGFVFALAAVMLVFALNLSGVFEFGTSATGVGGNLQMKSGLAGTFFTGFLATVVATPCSAPFLAPALGVAVTLPLVPSFMVFTAIGLGLSLPYLLLSLFPSAVKLLPKPGRWMETFKQLMAFLLYATVAYLVWVLAGQVNEERALNAAFGLVLIAMGVWAYGRWNSPGARRNSVRFAVATLVALIGVGLWLGWPRTSAANASGGEIVWEKWSPAAVEALRADNRVIYVDFTARWCATCQANEKYVFSSDKVLKTFRDMKIVTLRADWTNKDPLIAVELAKYQRSAIPFNLIYKPGNDKPTVLPELLTPDIVLRAINDRGTAAVILKPQLGEAT